MVEVVPRMIIAYSDQLKLGSDVSEAYGADLKFTIHNRVVAGAAPHLQTPK